jgi:archaellum component FlaC
MIDLAHIKDFIILGLSSIVGLIMFKMKQREQERVEHESKQDERIEKLEEKTHKIECDLGMLSERTQSIKETCVEIKDILKERK